MIEGLLTVLAAADLQPDPWELRDALWLAGHIVVAERTAGTEPPLLERVTVPQVTPSAAAEAEPTQEPAVPTDAATGAELYAAGSWTGGSSNLPAMEARSPAVPALRHQLQLARALKPFRRRVPASNSFVVDEAATAARVAEEGIWLPVLRPAPARWLDMALVVDTSPSMVVWRRTLAELQTLAERLGAFRIVRVLAIDSSIDPSVPLTVRPTSITKRPSIGVDRGPATLIDPTRRRVILVVTDAVGGAWRDGRMDTLLRRWGETTPVAVATVLPQRMWAGTGIRAVPAQLHAPAPGAANRTLRARAHSLRYAVIDPVPIPVMELSARWVAQWAHIVADAPDWQNAALLAGPAAMATPTVRLPTDGPAAEVVRRFRAAASPTAFKLACYLSAAWLNLPVMRLVQRAVLPESETSHLAEVFLSGLLRAVHSDDATTDPEIVQYDFLPGVRDELNTYLLRDEMLDVLRETSQFVTERFGQPLDFAALLADPEGTPLPALSGAGGQPLAYVAATVLAKLGGRYRSLASRLATAGPAAPAPTSLGLPEMSPQAQESTAVPSLRELGADPVTGKPMVVMGGRSGPYVTDGEIIASLRKGDDAASITDARAAELLAERRPAGLSTGKETTGYNLAGGPFPFAHPDDYDHETDHLSTSTLDAMNRVEYIDEYDLRGQRPYQGLDIRRTVLVRRSIRVRSGRERDIIMVFDATPRQDLSYFKTCPISTDSGLLGVLRPAQRYVLQAGLERAGWVNDFMAEKCGDDPWGFLRATYGGAGEPLALTPPIIERVHLDDWDSDDESMLEFVVCDGNHRVVRKVWNGRDVAAAVGVVSPPRQPYYVRPFSPYEWDITATNVLLVTPDPRFAYAPRHVDLEQLSAEARRELSSKPRDLLYRRYYRDLSLGFGPMGGQGGRYV